MAHALATGDYVCNVDADNFVGFGFVHYLRAVFRRRPNAIVATNRLDTRLNLGVHKGSMGRIAMSKANFDLLGGYDESARFKGWSGEDSDLVIRALRMFLRPIFIRERRFLRVVQHSDLDRVLLTECDDAGREHRRDRVLRRHGDAPDPEVRGRSGRRPADRQPRHADRSRPVEWHGRRRSA